jgi:hypothetical protein
MAWVWIWAILPWANGQRCSSIGFEAWDCWINEAGGREESQKAWWAGQVPLAKVPCHTVSIDLHLTAMRQVPILKKQVSLLFTVVDFDKAFQCSLA